MCESWGSKHKWALTRKPPCVEKGKRSEYLTLVHRRLYFGITNSVLSPVTYSETSKVLADLRLFYSCLDLKSAFPEYLLKVLASIL